MAHADHSPAGHGQLTDPHGPEPHVVSIPLLVGTWIALMVLTIATVGATRYDFGHDLNLILAMVIATVKAGLVCLIFIHLRWDKGFHSVVFLSSLAFVLLFVLAILLDAKEYQPIVKWEETHLKNVPTPAALAPPPGTRQTVSPPVGGAGYAPGGPQGAEVPVSPGGPVEGAATPARGEAGADPDRPAPPPSPQENAIQGSEGTAAPSPVPETPPE